MRNLCLSRALDHGGERLLEDAEELVRHFALVPKELLQALHPLEVTHNHAARVAQDVGDDKNLAPSLEEDAIPGLQDADIKLTSALFIQAVPDQKEATAKKIAQERLDLVLNKVKASFENTTNAIKGTLSIVDKKGEIEPDKLIGFIRVTITQKPNDDPKKSRRKLDTLFGSPDPSKDIYSSFAEQVVNQRKKEAGAKKVANGLDPNLVNPVDAEIQRVQDETDPAQAVEPNQ